jgi:hypothetical protein
MRAVMKNEVALSKKNEMMIEFARTKIIHVGGRMKKKVRVDEIETERVIDPLTMAEEILRDLDDQFTAELSKVALAKTTEEMDATLIEAGKAYRQAYALSHQLATITGRNIYRRRWDFAGRLSEFSMKRWTMVKRAVPVSPLPPKALEVIEQLKASAPPPKVFEGEHEYQAWLEANNRVEIDVEEYKSQTGRPKFPSMD